MTPASIFWALRPDELGRAATPSAAYASRLRRSSDDALRSRASQRWPEADLPTKDDVTVNIGRARFQALCQALRPDLLRFAFWLSRDLALAEDVVQETLLRAWKSRDSLQNEAAAKPWFLTIIRREYARTFERKRPVTVDVTSSFRARSRYSQRPTIRTSWTTAARQEEQHAASAIGGRSIAWTTHPAK